VKLALAQSLTAPTLLCFKAGSKGRRATCDKLTLNVPCKGSTSEPLDILSLSPELTAKSSAQQMAHSVTTAISTGNSATQLSFQSWCAAMCKRCMQKCLESVVNICGVTAMRCAGLPGSSHFGTHTGNLHTHAKFSILATYLKHLCYTVLRMPAACN